MNIRLLFLGLRGGCCCRMAGAFARRRAVPGVSVTVATVEPGNSDPLADEVMVEAGVPLTAEPCATLAEVSQSEYDIVVQLCPPSVAQLPLLTGRPTVVPWNLPDPAAFSPDPEARRTDFRNLRDTIRRQVVDFFEQGYLEAIADLRANSAMLIA